MQSCFAPAVFSALLDGLSKRRVGFCLTILHADWEEFFFTVRYDDDGVPVSYCTALLYLLAE